MHRFLWIYPLGIFSAAFVPGLPARHWLLLLGISALGAGLLAPKTRLFACLLLGFCHGAWWGHDQLAHRLPPQLDKTDYRVVGVVSSLPDTDSVRTRFEFSVEKLESLTGKPPPDLERLLLSWYRGATPRAGERWQLEVRLRSPRGFANPAGFDYSSWLLGEGVSATGYVRAGSFNQALGPDSGSPFLQLRQQLATLLDSRDDSAVVTGYMSALVLGDGSRIPAASWDVLVATGTVHLMVVSGLQVAIIAGGCFFIGLWLGRIGAALGSQVAAPLVGGVVALVGAILYALIAGNGLPLQRAVMMTAVVTVALMMRRRVFTWQGFGVALLGIALVDPLAVIRQGFWLSFGAVAALLSWFAPRPARRHWRQQVIDSQIVVFVALLAALLLFQGSVFLTSPLVNLIVIPWVSMVIVPLSLLGALLQMAGLLEMLPLQFLIPLGDWLWDCAAVQLLWLSQALEWAANYGHFSNWQPANARQWWLTAGLGLLTLMLFLPGGLGLRPLAALLLTGLMAGRSPPAPPLELTVLDVGQGLATVIRAGDKTLVYDTGPAYSPAFNAGSGIVLPYLRGLGVNRIDTLVVSHGDNDHAGGVAGLLAGIPADAVYSGADLSKAVGMENARQCHSGQHWRWGEVRFEFLSPAPNQPPAPATKPNNTSCVLLVRFGEVAILLPGDIEKSIEYRLTAMPLWSGEEDVDVLVAPHHGSRTSSSTTFIRWANPRHVVISAGYNHHFGHPHPEVVSAYQTHGSRILSTADSGALVFRWSGSGVTAQAEVKEYRQRPWRSWRER